jgi:hypothetical protein
MHESDDIGSSESREPAMLLFAAIAILLLSFFIVMNHSASLEIKKAERVTHGVVARFDPVGNVEDRLVSAVGEAPGEQSMIGRVGRLVATAFPLAEVRTVVPGRVLVVDLPLGHMWVENEVTPTDAGRRFIAALSQRLAEREARRFYDVEAWLMAAADMSRPLALARIAAFGDAMEESGAPPAAVATGVNQGSTSRLRLVFSAREAGDGRT